MISVCFQGKPFSITVMQVYVPKRNAEEAEIDWFYEDRTRLSDFTFSHEDLQELLELTPKK